jgi:hypothetical protein
MLEIASTRGALAIVKYLIEELGVDAHANEDAAFLAACRCGNMKTIKYLGLLIMDADVLSRALCEAVKRNEMEIVRYLVERDAPIHKSLLMAAFGGNMKITKYLELTLHDTWMAFHAADANDEHAAAAYLFNFI